MALSVLVLVVESRGAEEAHFRRLEIPAHESRLSELARVREFRCSGEWPGFSGQTLLIAELYREGKRVKAFRLSRAVYDESLKKRAGILSIGWHRDFHSLISVYDNGEFYSPWTESIRLPDFTPVDGIFFENSLPEDRKPEGENPQGYYSFKLYPVLGLCGQRQLKLSSSGWKDRPTFLAACKRAGAKDAVMIYLYQSDSGEEPAMRFEKGVNRNVP